MGILKLISLILIFLTVFAINLYSKHNTKEFMNENCIKVEGAQLIDGGCFVKKDGKLENLTVWNLKELLNTQKLMNKFDENKSDQKK